MHISDVNYRITMVLSTEPEKLSNKESPLQDRLIREWVVK